MTDEDDDSSEDDGFFGIDEDDCMFPPDPEPEETEPHKEATQTSYKTESIDKKMALITFLVLLGLFLLFIWWVLTL